VKSDTRATSLLLLHHCITSSDAGVMQVMQATPPACAALCRSVPLFSHKAERADLPAAQGLFALSPSMFLLFLLKEKLI
jgi:hypothetical protein